MLYELSWVAFPLKVGHQASHLDDLHKEPPALTRSLTKPRGLDEIATKARARIAKTYQSAKDLLIDLEG